ncbi:hypothetical protein LTR86_008401 [Recurvomyces mirabilis]|nr:hypothetical protein LTR86_008401 [Recurvomyces mirabilis]
MWDLDHWKWAAIRTIVNTRLYVTRSSWLAPTTQPDQVKIYQCRLYVYPCRVFVPRDHDIEAHPKLPLVIRVHGGGFIVNNPAVDDPLARHLANNAHCLVVSIDYGKAPQNKFPNGYEDVVAQALAIIDDPDLPIDKSRVVLSGTSAGGNLVLGAAQDSRLRGKLVGVNGVCPLVDVEQDAATKIATRPDPSISDFIGDTYDGIAKLYLDGANPPDLRDVRLSPMNFTARKDLPAHVLLIGVEHDMFCREAQDMFDKLKRLAEGGNDSQSVEWHQVAGQVHAFENFPIKDSIEKEQKRVEAVEQMYSDIAKWLRRVFAYDV